MNPWFRVYNDILTDSKLLSLSLDNQGIFFKYLAVSNQETPRGSLPSLEVLARQVGLRIDKVRSSIGAMIAAGLIDEDPDTKRLAMHGWSKRQFASDDATARVQKHRQGNPKPKRNVSRNVSETFPHAGAITETDAEADTEKTPLVSPPDRGGGTRPERVDRRGVDREGGPQGPTVDRHDVADLAAERWGPQGLETAESLLNLFRPEAVAYAAEETFAEHGRVLTLQGIRLWRKICREHPDGPPPPRPRLRRWGPEAPEKPISDHQRKMDAAAKRSAELRRELEEEERLNREPSHAAVS